MQRRQKNKTPRNKALRHRRGVKTRQPKQPIAPTNKTPQNASENKNARAPSLKTPLGDSLTEFLASHDRRRIKTALVLVRKKFESLTAEERADVATIQASALSLGLLDSPVISPKRRINIIVDEATALDFSRACCRANRSYGQQLRALLKLAR